MKKTLLAAAALACASTAPPALAGVTFLVGQTGESFEDTTYVRDAHDRFVGALAIDSAADIGFSSESTIFKQSTKNRISGYREPLNTLNIALADEGLSFQRLEFDVRAFADGVMSLIVLDQFGASIGGAIDIYTGQRNWISVVADGGQLIRSVQLVSTVNLHNVGETRLGGIISLAALRVSAAPEPSTWAMLIVGFAGLGAALRQSRHAMIRA